MPSRAPLTVLVLALSLFAACKVGPSYDFDKATPLLNDGNTLNTDGAALLKEVSDKYEALYAEAQKAEDPFEELANKQAQFKELEPKLATAKGKLGDASKKFDEAAKLNLPDWYKQYLTTLGDMNRGGGELADLFTQVVKNTYDTSITDEKDLDAKQKAIQDKIAAVNKKMDDLRATKTKIETEHKEDFKS